MSALASDQWLFRALNHTVDTAPEVWFWVFLSSVGNAAPALAIAGAFMSRHRRGLSAIAIGFIVGGLIVQLCKFAFDMPRPIAILGADVIVNGPRLSGHAFISGHATTAACLAVLLWHEGGRRVWHALALVVAALLVAVSRVAVGAHWPSDVIAGVVVGIPVGMFAWEAADRLRGRAEQIVASLGGVAVIVGFVITFIAHEPDLRPVAVEWRALGVALLATAIWRWRQVGQRPIAVAPASARSRLRPSRERMRWLKPAMGVLLLIGLVAVVDVRRLWAALSHASPGWFALALLFGVANSVVSALRWQTIAVRNGFAVTQAQSLRLYAEGIAANAVLPGGIVGGDVWRALGLVRLADSARPDRHAPPSRSPAGVPGRLAARWGAGDASPLADVSRRDPVRFAQAGTTVLVDRIGGVWGLCVVSAIAAGLAFVNGSGGIHLFDSDEALTRLTSGVTGCIAAPGGCPSWPASLRLYALMLVLGVLAPVALGLGLVRHLPGSWARRLASQTRITVESLPLSIVVQVFAAASLWACLQAVQRPVPFEWVAFGSAAIFIAAIVPAAVGGFGARELAMVAMLAPLGIAPELALAASVLYGLTATLQGLVGMALWFREMPVPAQRH